MNRSNVLTLAKTTGALVYGQQQTAQQKSNEMIIFTANTGYEALQG